MKKFFVSAVCALLIGVAFNSCQKPAVPDGKVGLTSFSLTKALNPSLEADVKATVVELDHTVSLVLPTSVKETSFVPTFTVSEHDVVTISGLTVESGATKCTIVDGTKIKVSDEVSAMSVEYTVKLDHNDGKAELLSVVFPADKNEDLTEDVAPEAISENMLVRVPAAAFQKTLVLKATAGENDVIKVNGQVLTAEGLGVDTKFPVDIEVSDAVAGVKTSYELKVGKILSIVVKHLTTYTEGTMASDVQMEINPKDDAPYITYVRKVDGDSYNRAAVAKFNGTAFETVGTSGFSADVKAASRATMTFDKNGAPYVKYVGGEVASRNSVQKFNGSAWELVGEGGGVSVDVNVNTSYLFPILFAPGADQPMVFFNGNTKNVPTYRNMCVAKFDGSKWSAGPVANVPTYGSRGASGGTYYISTAAMAGDKLYLLSALNEYGFYLHEVAANGDLLPIIEDYIPEGEKCGLPGNLGLACDSKGTPYLFEAVWSKNKMQIYKVDVAAKSVAEYASGLPIAISSQGGTTHDAAFGINPVSDMVVAVVDGGEDAKSAPVFKYLDDSLQWNDFKSEFADVAKSAFVIRFNSKGVGYVAFSTAKGIELFSIDYEEDVIPE
ncbi:MAG: hypothetical protein KBT05_03825 [Bacteroidales bacterium]|nr:hypothetical protein [Candidatus Cryptobacteroides caccocaballi]